jgi:uncharacterized protein (TIGR00369 family)
MEQQDTSFTALVGIDAREDGEGRATAELAVEDRHLNGYGTVHGGAIATLVDVAMGRAVVAGGADAPATIEMKVTYLDPGKPGTLVAEAKVRKRGRSITIVEAEVSQDGELIAHAIATFTS